MAADLAVAHGARATTRVMSCGASVVITGSDGRPSAELAQWAVDRLIELERRWSRFLPDSEVSALNAAGGARLQVSADTIELVTKLVQAWHLTDGSFDPTLLGTLVELGYAASRDDETMRTSLPATAGGRGRPDLVLLDPVDRVVQLPAGTVIDPGGLGKGLAADLVVAELVAAGATGALVEIGGDLRVAGTPPEGEAWLIAVDTAAERAHVRLVDGAVATSTSRLRTWTAGGERRHHLIDPTTLRPAATDVISCTVIAGTGAWAEAFTKIAFTHDAEAALDRFEQRRLAASVTLTDGHVTWRRTTSSWQHFDTRRLDDDRRDPR